MNTKVIEAVEPAETQLGLSIEPTNESCYILEIIWQSDKPKYERYESLEKAKSTKKAYEVYPSVLAANIYESKRVEA